MCATRADDDDYDDDGDYYHDDDDGDNYHDDDDGDYYHDDDLYN